MNQVWYRNTEAERTLTTFKMLIRTWYYANIVAQYLDKSKGVCLFKAIHLGISNIRKMMFSGLSLFICKKSFNNSILSKDSERESYILSECDVTKT